MSLPSPGPNNIEVPQLDQGHVSDSPPILIPITQPNNLITFRHPITILSESDIFKSRQVIDLRAITNSPLEPIEPTSITRAKKISSLVQSHM